MKRSALLDRLDVFTGAWEVESIIEGQAMTTGRTTFDWIEEGTFLVARSTTTVLPDAPAVWHQNAPRATTVVIAADDGSDGFSYAYADSRGVSRVYTMEFDGRQWTLTGRPGEAFHQRFAAAVTTEAIGGRYERSPDGLAWETDFEIRYRRVT